MLLDNYPHGPCLIVGDHNTQPVAIINLDWPDGLIDALAVFTMSDTARVELVMPAWIRPVEGDGAVCPCDGDPGCAGCGGTGVYRGASDTTIVYPLTPDGFDKAIAFDDDGERPLTVLGGFVPRCFTVALERRTEGPGLPTVTVLEALHVDGLIEVRML